MDEDELFETWPQMTWTVAGKTHVVPAITVKRTFGNRLAAHKRPYRKGARHDNTGPDPATWEVTIAAGRHAAEFHEAIPADFFPAGARALEDSFDREETGDLVTPHGVKRCKASNGLTIWSGSERDSQATTLTWVEDNEDDTDLAAFELPSARVAGVDGVDTFLGFSSQAGAGAGDFFDELKAAFRDLQGIAAYPGEALGQMVARVETITIGVRDTYEAYASAPAGVVDTMGALLNDPLAGPALRKLEELVDMACRAQTEAARKNGARTTKRYDRTVSIFDVAVDVGQNCNELMEINAGLDFYEIPRGTPIQVFA